MFGEHRDDDDHVVFSIESSNAFNRSTCQRTTDLLVPQVHMMACFVILLYGGNAPYMISGDLFLRSRDGFNKGILRQRSCSLQ